jgi:hypothetical protein
MGGPWAVVDKAKQQATVEEKQRGTSPQEEGKEE